MPAVGGPFARPARLPVRRRPPSGLQLHHGFGSDARTAHVRDRRPPVRACGRSSPSRSGEPRWSTSTTRSTATASISTPPRSRRSASGAHVRRGRCASSRATTARSRSNGAFRSTSPAATPSTSTGSGRRACRPRRRLRRRSAGADVGRLSGRLVAGRPRRGLRDVVRRRPHRHAWGFPAAARRPPT